MGKSKGEDGDKVLLQKMLNHQEISRNIEIELTLLLSFGSNQMLTSSAALDFGYIVKMCRNYIVNTISGLIFSAPALAISL